jgi:hypothetical protein
MNEQSSEVQLQLLTATVKLFLKQPDDTQDMVQRVLKMATEDRYTVLYYNFITTVLQVFVRYYQYRACC